MIAVSDRGTMLDASSVFYMDKLVTGAEGVGVIDIRQPIGDNIREFAKAKGKPVSEIIVAVLDRPRHEGLIDEIRTAGAGTRLMLDGDVAGGINAARVRHAHRPVRRHRRQSRRASPRRARSRRSAASSRAGSRPAPSRSA